MNGTSSGLLLDANVWLDAYLPERASQDVVSHLIDEAINRDIKLYFPITIIPDVFYLIAAHYKNLLRSEEALDEASAQAIKEIAWKCISNMEEVATPVGADASDLWMASHYRALHDDMEDCLVIAAAQRSKADFLVTSDKRLLAKAIVPTLSPEDMLAYLQSTPMDEQAIKPSVVMPPNR